MYTRYGHAMVKEGLTDVFFLSDKIKSKVTNILLNFYFDLL